MVGEANTSGFGWCLHNHTSPWLFAVLVGPHRDSSVAVKSANEAPDRHGRSWFSASGMARRVCCPRALCPVLFLFLLLAGSAEGIYKVQLDKAAQRVSRELKELSNDKSCVDEIQQDFKNAPYKTLPVNGTFVLENVANRVAGAVKEKVDALLNIKNHIENLYKDVSAFDTEVQDATALKGMYCHNTDTWGLPYSSSFHQRVNAEKSCIRLPWYENETSSSNLLFEAIAQKGNLDQVFKDNLEKSKTIKWQYYGTNAGYYSIYPANRQQPWLSSRGRLVASWQKDLVNCLFLYLVPTVVFLFWFLFVKDYYGIFFLVESKDGVRIVRADSREDREVNNHRKEGVRSSRKDIHERAGREGVEEEDEGDNRHDIRNYVSDGMLKETGQFYAHRRELQATVFIYFVAFTPLTIWTLLVNKQNAAADSEFPLVFSAYNLLSKNGRALSLGLIALIVMWSLTTLMLSALVVRVTRRVHALLLAQENDDGDSGMADRSKRGGSRAFYLFFFMGVIVPYFGLLPISMNFFTDIPTYDPRVRPWYVKAAGEPKDVVLIIDTSGSMAEYGRMTYAKEGAARVLGTLNDDDRLAVISFDNTVHYPAVEFNDTLWDDAHKDLDFLDREELLKYRKYLGEEPFDYACAALNETMAPANAHNKRFYSKFIQDLVPKGKTNYLSAFDAAFGYLNARGNTTRKSIILFLTDGAPTLPHTDGTKEEAITKNFKEAKEKVDAYSKNMAPNPPQIFTFVLGSSLSEKHQRLLGDIASPLQFVDDGDVGALITKMGTYYERQEYLYSSQTAKVRLTLPYFDFSGIGMCLSAAVPVYQDVGQANEKQVGVAAVDLAVLDLFGSLATPIDVPDGSLSFAFMIDLDGRVLFHPSLPDPDSSSNDPIFVSLDKILFATRCNTSDADISGTAIMRHMMTGGKGSARAKIKMNVARGSAAEGSRAVEFCCTVHWQKVPNVDFSAAFVLADSEATVRVIPPGSITHAKTAQDVIAKTQEDYMDYYHRIDLVPSRNSFFTNGEPTCETYFNNVNVTWKEATWKVAPSAFQDSYYYVQEGDLDRGHTLQEKVELVDGYNALANRNGTIAREEFEKVFKPGVRDSVFLTRNAGVCWAAQVQDVRPGQVPASVTARKTIVARYIGTDAGVFRSLPGQPSSKFYDPRKRPWYIRSAEYPSKTCLSTYVDAGTSFPITTVSKAIMGDASTTVAAVVGVDMSMETLTSIFVDAINVQVETLRKSKNTELFKKLKNSVHLIVDKSGSIILVHDPSDFLDGAAARLKTLMLENSGAPFVGKLSGDGEFQSVIEMLPWNRQVCRDLETMYLHETLELSIGDFFSSKLNQIEVVARVVEGTNAIWISFIKSRSPDSSRPRRPLSCKNPPCKIIDKVDTCTNIEMPWEPCTAASCEGHTSFGSKVTRYVLNGQSYYKRNVLSHQIVDAGVIADRPEYFEYKVPCTKEEFGLKELGLHGNGMCFVQPEGRKGMTMTTVLQDQVASACPQPTPFAGDFYAEQDLWYFPCFAWWTKLVISLVVIGAYIGGIKAGIIPEREGLIFLFSPFILTWWLLEVCMIPVIFLAPVELDRCIEEIHEATDEKEKYFFIIPKFFVWSCYHILFLPQYVIFSVLIVLGSFLDLGENAKNFRDVLVREDDELWEDKLRKNFPKHALVALKHIAVLLGSPVVLAYVLIELAMFLTLMIVNPYEAFPELIDSLLSGETTKDLLGFEGTTLPEKVLRTFLIPQYFVVGVLETVVLLLELPLMVVITITYLHFPQTWTQISNASADYWFKRRFVVVPSQFVWLSVDLIAWGLAWIPFVLAFCTVHLGWALAELVMVPFIVLLGGDEWDECKKKLFDHEHGEAQVVNTDTVAHIMVKEGPIMWDLIRATAAFLTQNYRRNFLDVPASFGSVLKRISVRGLWLLLHIPQVAIGLPMYLVVAFPSPGEFMSWAVMTNVEWNYKLCYDELLEAYTKTPYSYRVFVVIPKHFLETLLLQWVWMFIVESVMYFILAVTHFTHVEFIVCNRTLRDAEFSRFKKMYTVIPRHFFQAIVVFLWVTVRFLLLLVLTCIVTTFFVVEAVMYVVVAINIFKFDECNDHLAAPVHKLVYGREKSTAGGDVNGNDNGDNKLRRRQSGALRRQFTLQFVSWIDRVTDPRLYYVVPLYFILSILYTLMYFAGFIFGVPSAALHGMSVVVVYCSPMQSKFMDRYRTLKEQGKWDAIVFYGSFPYLGNALFFYVTVPFQMGMFVFLLAIDVLTICRMGYVKYSCKRLRNTTVPVSDRAFLAIPGTFGKVIKDFLTFMTNVALAAYEKRGDVWEEMVLLALVLVGIALTPVALALVFGILTVQIVEVLVIVCTVVQASSFAEDMYGEKKDRKTGATLADLVQLKWNRPEAVESCVVALNEEGETVLPDTVDLKGDVASISTEKVEEGGPAVVNVPDKVLQKLINMGICGPDTATKLYTENNKDELATRNAMVTFAINEWQDYFVHTHVLVHYHCMLAIGKCILFACLIGPIVTLFAMFLSVLLSVVFAERLYKALFAKPDGEEAGINFSAWPKHILDNFVYTLLFWIYLPLQIFMLFFIVIACVQSTALLEDFLDPNVPYVEKVFGIVYKHFIITLRERGEDIGVAVLTKLLPTMVFLLLLPINLPMFIVVNVFIVERVECIRELTDKSTTFYYRCCAVIIPHFLVTVWWILYLPFQLVFFLFVFFSMVQLPACHHDMVQGKGPKVARPEELNDEDREVIVGIHSEYNDLDLDTVTRVYFWSGKNAKNTANIVKKDGGKQFLFNCWVAEHDRIWWRALAHHASEAAVVVAVKLWKLTKLTVTILAKLLVGVLSVSIGLPIIVVTASMSLIVFVCVIQASPLLKDLTKIKNEPMNVAGSAVTPIERVAEGDSRPNPSETPRGGLTLTELAKLLSAVLGHFLLTIVELVYLPFFITAFLFVVLTCVQRKQMLADFGNKKLSREEKIWRVVWRHTLETMNAFFGSTATCMACIGRGGKVVGGGCVQIFVVSVTLIIPLCVNIPMFVIVICSGVFVPAMYESINSRPEEMSKRDFTLAYIWVLTPMLFFGTVVFLAASPLYIVMYLYVSTVGPREERRLCCRRCCFRVPQLKNVDAELGWVDLSKYRPRTVAFLYTMIFPEDVREQAERPSYVSMVKTIPLSNDEAKKKALEYAAFLADKDGDGKVTMETLGRILRDSGLRRTDDELRIIFNANTKRGTVYADILLRALHKWGGAQAVISYSFRAVFVALPTLFFPLLGRHLVRGGELLLHLLLRAVLAVGGVVGICVVVVPVMAVELVMFVFILPTPFVCEIKSRLTEIDFRNKCGQLAKTIPELFAYSLVWTLFAPLQYLVLYPLVLCGSTAAEKKQRTEETARTVIPWKYLSVVPKYSGKVASRGVPPIQKGVKWMVIHSFKLLMGIFVCIFGVVVAGLDLVFCVFIVLSGFYIRPTLVDIKASTTLKEKATVPLLYGPPAFFNVAFLPLNLFMRAMVWVFGSHNGRRQHMEDDLKDEFDEISVHERAFVTIGVHFGSMLGAFLRFVMFGVKLLLYGLFWLQAKLVYYLSKYVLAWPARNTFVRKHHLMPLFRNHLRLHRLEWPVPDHVLSLDDRFDRVFLFCVRNIHSLIFGLLECGNNLVLFALFAPSVYIIHYPCLGFLVNRGLGNKFLKGAWIGVIGFFVGTYFVFMALLLPGAMDRSGLFWQRGMFAHCAQVALDDGSCEDFWHHAKLDALFQPGALIPIYYLFLVVFYVEIIVFVYNVYFEEHAFPLTSLQPRKVRKLLGRKLHKALTDKSVDYVELVELNLKDRKIHWEDCFVLAAVLHKVGPTLRKIHLTNNAIDAHGLKLLANVEADLSNVNEFHIEGNCLGDSGCQILSESFLPKMVHLKKLSFGHNGVGDAGFKAVVESLRSQITVLKCDGNNLSDQCFNVVGDLLGSSLTRQAFAALEELDLSGNHLTGRCNERLVEAGNRMEKLAFLYLNSNTIDERGLAELQEFFLRLKCIKTVDLSHCNFGKGFTEETKAALREKWNALDVDEENLLLG